MKKLKHNKPLQYLLGAILFILLSCYLPQQILFWKLCTEQDQDIPPNTEVLISACKRPIARGVPGGEVLFVHELKTGKIYLLDLRTGEKRKVPNDPLLLEKGIFLSSNLVWLEGSRSNPENQNYRPDYILDLTDGKHYELLNLDWLPFKEGKFDPKHYTYFQFADYVYLHHSKNVLIAFPSNFRQHPENAVILSQSTLASASVAKGEILEELIELINELSIDYEIIDLSTTLYTDIPSPTNRYSIRNDGIYISETNASIIDREYTGGRFIGGYFKSWYYDESAVVVQEDSTYLFSNPLGPRFFLIPRPILKLNLP